MNRTPGKEEANVSKKLTEGASKRGVKINEGSLGIGGPAYNMQNKEVYTAGSKNAGFLAHELGHAHYDAKSTKTGVGKASHKIYKATGGALNHLVLSPAVGIAAGIHSGKKAAKLEAEGKKESKLNRHLGWVAPLAVSAAPLAAEALASRKGLKLMKSSGASKKLLKTAKKELTSAWGTYGSLAAVNAGTGEISRGLSYNHNKKKLEKQKKQDKDKL